MRICRKCDFEKILDEYANTTAYKDGKERICKECKRKYNKAYFQTQGGKNAHNKSNRKYYSTDKGKIQRKKDNLKWRERPHYIEGKRAEYSKKYKQSDKYKEQSASYSVWVRKNNPQKYKARYKLRNAVIKGLVVKPTKCEICNATKDLEGHHPDYSKPLDVIWMCKDCHVEEHIKEGTWKK